MMAMQSFHQITSLSAQSASRKQASTEDFSAVYKRGLQLQRLADQIHAWLPDYLRPMVSIANLRSGVLVLTCPNAAAVARVNLLTADLIAHLTAIKVRVHMVRVDLQVQALGVEPRPKKPKKGLSAQGYAAFRECHQALSDSELKTALATLLSHAPHFSSKG